ncbi:MAG: RNA 2',3'-cyclic phosphodiesterase [Marinobacter sp.]|uniref:RNA 2',3'-cyclic phosphodiesterase n=1 Tax=Marinobacter sp. TaxID=50741 RepID=UPI00329762A5
MDKPQTRRLFFGVEIPEGIKQRLLWIQTPMVGARWQTPEQMHLTLVFLGSVEAQRFEDVREAARNLPLKPFELTVAGLGCFGHPDHPKNLWAGVHSVDELAELKGMLSQRLAFSGFALEKRAFRPHITLARFKKESSSVREVLQKHQAFHAGTFLVTTFALVESNIGEQGSVYQVVETFPLVGAE